MENTLETQRLAERVLEDVFQGPIRLADGTGLADRSHVFRFVVADGPSAAPVSLIVKRARAWAGAYDPDSSDPWNPARPLLGEWAGLRFLGAVAGDSAIAPRIYGGSREHGLVVIEDLGSGERPDQLLLGDDPQRAEAALIELAAQLGRLHARTIGREPEYAAICAALGFRAAVEEEPDIRPDLTLHATLELLKLAPPPGLSEDLAKLMAAIQEPGPFWAYTHGDPCPDNWLRAGGALRLLDFERGAFRHALLDGVYGRILFPTCWCVNRLPEHLPRAMEAAYRAELAVGQPAAADDTLFGQAVAATCAHWGLDLCRWVVERPAWYAAPRVISREQQWGIATIQQRALVRFQLLAEITAEHRHLESIGAAFEQIAVALRRQWPPAADAMPYYPAFRAGR